jgi:hypothetical protein
MKLADSWSEVVPAAAPSAHLYDESEESDEVDESKDGCGGVEWWKYVLYKPCTSNDVLFDLARDVRGVEKRLGKQFELTRYKTIHREWEDASRQFLRKGHDYFTEFLAALDRVCMPKGETLESAFERAKLRQPPSKILDLPNNALRLLASLCRELQEMFGDQPIMLHQVSIAKLFDVSQQTISTWIKALKTLRVLRLAEPPIPNARAARYYFIE